jgi:hypothetical protein
MACNGRSIATRVRPILLTGLCLLLAGVSGCSERTAKPQPVAGGPTTAEMTACSKATYSDRPVVQSYWAPGTFEVEPFFGQTPRPDDFRRNWYSTQLCAMGEPRLSPLAEGGTRIRFIWLRAFHPGISVRVEHDQYGARLTAVELSGAGGYAAGTVARQVDKSLSADEWATLEASIDQVDFWGLATSQESNGLDGSQWIIEIVTQGRYYVVDRWGGGALAEPGRYMIELSDLDPENIY